MSLLFSPYTIKQVRLRNRIVVSPMCQYSSVDGFVNEWHEVHLGSRAAGGAGLVIQEASAVTPEGRISYGDVGIWSDEQVPALTRLVKIIRGNGAVAGIQLAHAGRKASADVPWNGGRQLREGPGSWQTVAPSAIPFRTGDLAPAELTRVQIDALVHAFGSASRRALEAGYEVIEVHAAHGYLINQFLSPLSNTRTDDYGGSFSNRIRFLLEVLASVQEAWPETLPLFVRISASEWAAGGWTLEGSIALAKILKEKGVDLIDASSGGNSEQQQIKVEPGYQVPFADQIRQKAGIATGAVGLINSAEQAEQILQEGKADLIFMARELLRDPYFPLHAAKQLGDDIEWPKQYVRAKPR